MLNEIKATNDEAEVKETGETIELEKKTKEKVDVVPFFQLFRYATSGEKLIMTLGMVAAVLNGASLPLFSVLLGELLDAFGQEDLANAREAAFWLLLLGIGSFLVSWLQVSTWRYTAIRQSNRIREIYLDAILQKSISWYDIENASEVAVSMESDINMIQKGIDDKVTMTAQFLAMFFVGILVGFVQGWRLTLVILAMFPLLAISGGVMGYLLTSYTTLSQKAYAKAGARASELFEAIRTVTSFNTYKRESERYNECIMEAKKAGIKKSIAAGGSMGIVMLVMMIAYGVSLWYGARLIANGTHNSFSNSPYTGGDVIAIFFSVLIGSFAIGQAAPYFPGIISARASAYKVWNIIDFVDFSDGSDKKGDSKQEITGKIEIRDVSFSYPSRPDMTVLEGFSIDVDVGQTVALVGESGSGKSTTVGLLERFYEPSSGTIRVDGMDIRDYDLEYIRQNIGLVSQQPILFYGTIRENILYGKEDGSEEEMIEASKLANAHSFISELPDGYDTFVGGKDFLSGGQKQRVAIARALIKRPKILLLDEATSALDNESEAIVQEALDDIMQNHTTIVIAHRLSTIRGADCIYVLDKGKIVEQGTHDELMSLEGLYNALVMAQMKTLEGEDEKGSPDGMTSPEVELISPITTNPSNLIIEQETNDEETKNEDLKLKEELPNVSHKRIFQMARRSYGWLFIAFISATIHGAIFPSFSILLGEMIELFYNPDTDEMLRQAVDYMILFFILGGLIFVFSTMQSYSMGIVGERMTFELRAIVFNNILRQNIGWFDEPRNRPGILSTRLANDAEKVRAIVVDRIGMTLQSAAMIVIGIAIAFYYGWQLALAILGIAPLIAAAGALQFKFFAGDTEVTKLYEEANTMAIESIENIRTVKSFTHESKLKKDFGDRLRSELIENSLKKTRASGIPLGISNFILFGVYSFAFFVGSYMVEAGWMTFGDVINVFFGIVMSFMSAGQIIALVPDAKEAQLASNAVYQIMDTKSEIDPDDQDGEKKSVEGCDIEFQDVVFRYPTRPDVTIFDGLSFRVSAGSTFALVGPSGGGKSSVMALLQRFYDPENGNISIGETDIKEFNVGHLRESIGIVSQEPTLFHTTIRENVIYSCSDDVNDEQIIDALRRANAWEFVESFSEGLETDVGARGIQLSGGQRQRIAIARALLKNPKILLLDEATSALDNESERLVQEALEELMKGRTTIVIAHRLSTIQNSDCIAVLESGRIVEQGSHQELLEMDGVYSNLYRIGEGEE